jgi:probable rRNA maturation factor
MAIRFNYADRKLNISYKKDLKTMLLEIFNNENKTVGVVDYIFCSDEYLLEINQRCLNHDFYTDIITFPLSDIDKPVDAEIYISTDRVRENAIINTTTFKLELARVVAHGSLHLCGYKDKTRCEIEEMRAKESFYIKTINT